MDIAPCFDEEGRSWRNGDFVVHLAGAWAHLKEDVERGRRERGRGSDEGQNVDERYAMLMNKYMNLVDVPGEDEDVLADWKLKKRAGGHHAPKNWFNFNYNYNGPKELEPPFTIPRPPEKAPADPEPEPENDEPVKVHSSQQNEDYDDDDSEGEIEEEDPHAFNSDGTDPKIYGHRPDNDELDSEEDDTLGDPDDPLINGFPWNFDGVGQDFVDDEESDPNNINDAGYNPDFAQDPTYRGFDSQYDPGFEEGESPNGGPQISSDPATLLEDEQTPGGHYGPDSHVVGSEGGEAGSGSDPMAPRDNNGHPMSDHTVEDGYDYGYPKWGIMYGNKCGN